jgi:DNA-binding TFAR19-related protein (PDSD5 family)
MYPLTYPVMKIKTVKPEKAMGIENSIINAARNNMLKNRVTEAELVNLLEKDSEKRGEQKITVIHC